MNVWDILIIAAIAGVALVSFRGQKKKTGCHSECGGQCSHCPYHKD